MSADSSSDVKFDIGHVLFIDIVGYSKLMITEQSDQLQTLRQIVRATEQFKKAEAEGKLLRLPTGDGGALVFRNTLEAPVLCALEIGKALKSHPELKVRMGIHSGPVNEITDLNEQANIAGAGINMAQRVMDCGDAGHILLSKRVADDLEQYPQWRSHLTELGEYEVKHGARVSVVNLYTDDAGNAALPARSGAAPKTAPSSSHRLTSFQITVAAVILLIGLGIPALIFTPAILKSLRSTSPASKSAPATAVATVPEKSIAVLPFENLSSDKENAYFAAGIQDEILTRLAKIGALKVISRSSTQQYQSNPANLREIAQQLGVANILEGSVQKAGAAVHVNVQLIKAVTDDHLWAESYDRTLENIFGVEAEIAQTVAEALKAKLTGAEEKVLAQKPTDNPAAYDAYLRGTAQSRHRGESDQIKAALISFEQAVRLDPKFAVAWAALSRNHSLLFFHDDATPARRAEAEKALTEAVRLQPDLAEVQLARAYFQYWVRRDYSGSLELMRQLHISWPNNAEVLEVMAYISARLGQWKESLAYIQQAVALSPKETDLRIQSLSIALAMRDFPLVIKMAEEALQLWPDDLQLLGMKASALLARGQLNEVQPILANVTIHPTDIDAASLALMYQIMLRRDQAGARMLLDSYPEAANEKHFRFLAYWAMLQETAGRKEDARATWTRARDYFAPLVRAQPDNGELVGPMAFILAFLDQRDEAFKAVEKFNSFTVGDARTAGTLEEVRARICARLGDKECAIKSLERLLSAPSDGIFGAPVTRAILKLDPMFDPLRGDPRFEKLCQEPTQ